MKAPTPARLSDLRWSAGLLVSQLLTLYITPVLYLYLEQFQVWLRRSKTAAAQELPVDVVNLGSR